MMQIGAEHATHRHRLRELDALRGLAAIAVTLFHMTFYVADMFPGTPLGIVRIAYGWCGVQLFFAISGFVILMTLDSTRRARDFARARFWRLFPTYWLAIAITYAAMHLFGPAKLVARPGDLLANLTMLQFYAQPFGDVRMVDGAYWSLNVELVFYAVMLGLWRMRLLARIEPVLIGWMLLRWLWVVIPEPLQRPLLTDHIMFFAIGILAYRIRAGQRTPAQQMPAFAMVVATVVGTFEPAMWLLTAGLIALFLGIATGRLGWVDMAWLRWFGAISYPLYLLHGYLGDALILQLEWAGWRPDPAVAATFAVSVALAAAVTYGFERPLHAWVRDRRRRAGSALLAPVTAA